ncbi:MAG: PEGA domain-containing protein [Proteobacteria bacterium]|nr:PEGA domain-containing protein [Pseudomonadota bacterium]
MRAATTLLLSIVLGCALFTICPPGALAQGTQKPAAEHFARAVALFNEGDLRASLVEFQKAYELSPNPSVLYNLGQVHFQLQEYAAALKALSRFLAESSPSAANRADAETTVQTLRKRVGRIFVRSNLEGAEIAVDDEVVGRSPLTTPVVVSIGRRRISARAGGYVPATQVVDIAGGDTVTIRLDLAAAAAGLARGGAAGKTEPVDPLARRRTWRIVSWTTTGVLAGAAVAAGVLALMASADLKAERDRFGATAERLTRYADRSQGFGLATDVLTGAAIVAGGVSLYLQLSAPAGAEGRSRRSAGASSVARDAVGLRVSPTSVALTGSF